MSFVPVPVAAPLIIAGLLLAIGHYLPRRAPDIVAVLTCLATAAICVLLAREAAHAPITYWFGNWTPRPNLTIGIGFRVDLAGAILAGFIATLFALTMLFAWGLFADTHEHFHVLMLLFMAGMIGFVLTHDLFNLFVWFEVMSVAGFALTAAMLRPSALEGALNFTIVNTLGAYLILSGIGLIYARAGALDFSAIAANLHADDAVALAGFALVSAGLLIKAAQVPFHFWLADAHAVAPSPVSVIFSGAMVSLGLFGVARLIWPAYAASPTVQHAAHTLLAGMGAASALVGAAMALLQRHIKRLLAFSTIAHVGIMLIGVSTLTRQGLAGTLGYMLGHGLVKGALFMLAGILMARCRGIDDITIRGRGRAIWPAGIAMAAAGLLLGGLPIGLLDGGASAIVAAAPGWAVPFIVVGIGGTGGAVLRVTGRVFLGWGRVAGAEATAPTEDEVEGNDRPLWLMLLPALIMVILALALPAAPRLAHAAAAQFTLGVPPGLEAAEGSTAAWLAFGLTLILAIYQLFRGAISPTLRRLAGLATAPISVGLQAVHSGMVGDYLLWTVLGLLLFAAALA